MSKSNYLELSSFRIDSYHDKLTKACFYFEVMRIIERNFDERCDLLFTPKNENMVYFTVFMTSRISGYIINL